MLNNKGFDLWADGYDKTVGVSDEGNAYPFAGYKDVLGTIYKIIMDKPNAVVLDIGFGTGTLTTKLYENGCTIYGQDFSARMIELASEKMPNAHLYQGDFTQGLVEPLLAQRYDFIVATYSLHHLTYEQKVSFLRVLQDHLNPGGQILIGDVAFENRSLLEQCRKDVGDEWDDDEIYFVVDELKKNFPALAFTRISYCAGILFLSMQDHSLHRSMISIEEIPVARINEFWKIHIKYLVDDGIISDEEDIVYFTGKEYRGILEDHMIRSTDKQHMVYFCQNGERIGAASYCTYQSEDGKCFILDYWVFPQFRGNGTGHRCFEALEQYTKADGAKYYELNSMKEDSIRFWKSIGFVENGKDEYDMLLLVKR